MILIKQNYDSLASFSVLCWKLFCDNNALCFISFYLSDFTPQTRGVWHGLIRIVFLLSRTAATGLVICSRQRGAYSAVLWQERCSDLLQWEMVQRSMLHPRLALPRYFKYLLKYEGWTKGPVTQAPTKRTTTRTIKMHALDWLNAWAYSAWSISTNRVRVFLSFLSFSLSGPVGPGF